MCRPANLHSALAHLSPPIKSIPSSTLLEGRSNVLDSFGSTLLVLLVLLFLLFSATESSSRCDSVAEDLLLGGL